MYIYMHKSTVFTIVLFLTYWQNSAVLCYTPVHKLWPDWLGPPHWHTTLPHPWLPRKKENPAQHWAQADAQSKYCSEPTLFPRTLIPNLSLLNLFIGTNFSNWMKRLVCSDKCLWPWYCFKFCKNVSYTCANKSWLKFCFLHTNPY